MSQSLQYFFRQLTDWLFRRRSPALILMRSGLIITIASVAGFAVVLAIPADEGHITLSIDSASSIPSFLSALGVIVGIIFTVFGAIWEYIRYRDEERQLQKRRVIVIEVRGLRDTSGTPLASAVPAAIEGRRESLLVDLRQISDGRLSEPASAITELSTLPKELERRYAEGDRSDVRLVYGGLAPVPLTFLTGVLMDDEGAVTVMDWDRHRNRWRELDSDDDGFRFELHGLDHVYKGAPSVALAISCSYSVDLDGIHRGRPGTPVVEMRLSGGTTDAHWSEAKQQALGQQFLNTVIALGNCGVTELHLFIAAPNSVVFLFGRLYDKRNLPSIRVYQYERGQELVFPWCIRMPVAGLVAGEFVPTTSL